MNTVWVKKICGSISDKVLTLPPRGEEGGEVVKQEIIDLLSTLKMLNLSRERMSYAVGFLDSLERHMAAGELEIEPEIEVLLRATIDFFETILKQTEQSE